MFSFFFRKHGESAFAHSSSGRAFHAVGPATENDLEPNFVPVRGTSYKERNRLGDGIVSAETVNVFETWFDHHLSNVRGYLYIIFPCRWPSMTVVTSWMDHGKSW